MRPISILCNVYLPEHYKIESGSSARLVMVRFGGRVGRLIFNIGSAKQERFGNYNNSHIYSLSSIIVYFKIN